MGAPADSQPPGPPAATDAAATGGNVLVLRETFTGHYENDLATAHQTMAVEFVWQYGPDDIHDIYVFVFTAGSYMFTESIGGACGGARREAGLR